MAHPFVSVLPAPTPTIVSVGTATPRFQYRQDEIADMLRVPEGLPRRLFQGGGIDTRSLYMEPPTGDVVPEEDEAQLLARHRRGVLELGRAATERCLANGGLQAGAVDFLCCVSSTGFIMPGVTAMFVRHLGFRRDCQRIDIVGMGCHAAVNGLHVVANWAVANRERYALLVCCEINSAIHVRDDRPVTALVNSLFGDGCAALLVASAPAGRPAPRVLGFCSHAVPDAWNSISYHWSTHHQKFELYLDKAIPDILGEHSPTPIGALLKQFNLCRCDIRHWIIHAGGKKVIAAVQEANGLNVDDVRHSINVLKTAGNVGSATVVFSYEALLAENVVETGDYGVLVTMGPGAGIETALLQW